MRKIIIRNKDSRVTTLHCTLLFALLFLSANTYSADNIEQTNSNQENSLEQIAEPQVNTASNSNVEKVDEEFNDTLLANVINNERNANRNLFSLIQHRQNYLLPLSFSSGPNTITLDGVGEESVDRIEAKYQLSVKTPLWLQEDDVSGVYFGFTAVSFWQLYNDETSKPFRETNYEPEVFYQFNSKLSLLGYKFNILRVGINHMSNGQSGLKSRSWNRITATALFSDKNTAYYLKTWIRLPEDEKTSLLDPLGDDNSDINDYYGRVELGFGIQFGELVVSSRIRNNLSFKENRSGIEINLTYPITTRYDFLLQYFNGYGDSLIDYNRHMNRISAGVQIRFL